MNREQVTELIIEAKRAKGLTYQAIADKVGLSVIYTTSALLGQAIFNAAEAETVTTMLGLSPEVAVLLQESPLKGSLGETVSADPLIYRLHEINQVYGTTIKALIHEMFGDGIMSAIDFEMYIEKVPDPKGDRVKLTYNGKFLPYRKW